MKKDRRTFLTNLGAGALAAAPLGAQQSGKDMTKRRHPEPQTPASPPRYGTQHCVMEWQYTSAKAYTDPFNELELDVQITDPSGKQYTVPAFWAGESAWKVRFNPPVPGRYTVRTIASDAANSDLHGIQSTLEISEYKGSDPLKTHGFVRVAPDRRHFAHEDGTPFFWLGDTWWMGLCKRLRWPEDLQKLAADRVAKGFTVVQIVAGLYPDMPAFDPRGANEAGYPWERDYSRINPHYFDMADLRIQEIVERGLVPCIVGCWGYFLMFMGEKKIKQHWRNIVARWGAYPVMWCLAGEGTMPYYLSKTPKEDSAKQKTGWTEIARYVRQIDPYHHPITIHPSQTARDSVDDPTVLDFDMMQTGHSDRESYPNTVNKVVEGVAREPRMPTLVGEACYEGILDENRQEVSRFVFWAAILSGAAGHTYGGNGIWQVNTAEQPYGPSPHGRSWAGPPWDVAAQLPGSLQVGLGKKLLASLPWSRFEPHPEWAEPHWSKENYQLPYAAGIPGEVRVVFMPRMWDPPKVKHLEPGIAYSATLFDPRTGEKRDFGQARGDANGDWQIPIPPTFEQWVLVLVKK